jgi:hypothetical protein
MTSENPEANPLLATPIRGQVRCPRTDCQSLHISTVLVASSVGTETVELYGDTCLDCGAVGDFAGNNPTIVERARLRSEATEIRALLNDLAKTRSTALYIARVLGLPWSTMESWLKGDCCHAPGDLTLLRMVHTYPWLLSVADAKFAADRAKVILVEQAAMVLQRAQEVVKASEEDSK